MDPEQYVEELFARYEPTPELDEFREEVLGNLHARIAQLTDEGVTPADAARRAQTELGDIDAIAREMSRERAVDVYNHMYLHQKVRLSTRRVITIVALAVALVAGVAGMVPFIAWYVMWKSGVETPQLELTDVYLAAWVGLVIVAAAIGGIVVVALTAESTARFPMRVRRAVLLGVGVALAVNGALFFGLNLMQTFTALAIALPTFVIGLAIAVTVGLTQTNRLKPWALREQQRQAELGTDNFSQDPALAARFGMYVVTLWLAAIVVGIVLAVNGVWAWCWTPLAAAVVIMMLLIARMGFGVKSDER